MTGAESDEHGVYVDASWTAGETVCAKGRRTFDHSRIRLRRCPVAMAREVRKAPLAAVSSALRQGSPLSAFGVTRLSSGAHDAAWLLAGFESDFGVVIANRMRQLEGR